MLLTILAAVAAFVQIFFGFLYYVERIQKNWRPWRQASIAGTLTLALLGLCAFITRDKVFVNKQDLLALREMADDANKKNDYDAALRIATWTLQYDPDDEELYRIRARAYKRKGPEFYPNEIRDRQIVLRLNPTRELNHLPIIEDYILLGKYQNARAWIQEHRGAVEGRDETIMFEFFDLLCDAAEGLNYTSRLRKFQEALQRQPLTKKFADKIWEWEYVEAFLKQDVFSEPSRNSMEATIRLMRETAR